MDTFAATKALLDTVFAAEDGYIRFEDAMGPTYAWNRFAVRNAVHDAVESGERVMLECDSRRWTFDGTAWILGPRH